MRQTSIFRNVMIVIFCLAIGCIGGLFIAYYLGGGFQHPMAQGTQIEIQDGADVAAVAQAYQDAVVSIKVISKNNSDSFSLGSGVCVHAGGYIVTNYHVIAQSKSNPVYEIYTFLNGDQEKGYKSELLWANDDLDLAIIKSSYTDIRYAKMKDRSFACSEGDKLKIGDEVIAIGTPIEMNLQNTTTFGRVNGLNRVGAANGDVTTTRIYEYLIQHQATINSGNSGGPLIDSKGYVVGINSCSMVEDKNENYVAEINFAVPIYPIIKIINNVVESYENKQDYVEPILAITCQDKVFSKYITGAYSGNGVLIKTNPYSAIGSLALLKNDIILQMTYNQKTYDINSVYDFYYNCLRAGKGASVTFVVERAGTKIETSAVVLP